MTTLARPHGFVTKGIHWLSAALIGYGYLKGLETVAELSHPGVMRLEILFALLLGGIFTLRLFWTKRIAGATRLPADAPRWEHIASRGVHVGLYAGVYGIVLSGLGIAFAYATPGLGGMFLDAMIGLHEVALAALPVLLVAHIAGALWHKFMRRDAVLESMTGRLPF